MRLACSSERVTTGLRSLSGTMMSSASIRHAFRKRIGHRVCRCGPEASAFNWCASLSKISRTTTRTAAARYGLRSEFDRNETDDPSAMELPHGRWKRVFEIQYLDKEHIVINGRLDAASAER